MKQKKLNMKLLFGEDDPITDIVELKIFHKAALLYNFDIAKHFQDFNEEETDLLLELSFQRSTDGMRRLSKEDRLNIIENGIKIENLEKTIDELKIESVFTNLIKRIVKNEDIKVATLSNVELYYAIVLSKIFPGKFGKEEFQRSYARRQFFRPFENITKHFAGRKEDIDKITDYVDWLPKSSWAGKVGAGLRSMINFHEKPPLLIQGIGGIGKSTLVSKFILDHNKEKEGKLLPFVYVDFDIPGFSIKEPLTILIEALRQISIQFPQHESLLTNISKRISQMIGVGYKLAEIELPILTSTESSRGFLFDHIENIIQEADLDLDLISESPILVVFDSFEEMQHRASDNELTSFISFISEISQRIPRIRPVFVGRSEIDETLQSFKFQKITITDFDKESAHALLRNWGVSEEKTLDLIYENFGGNPLMLRLSKDLALKGDFDNLDPEEIKGKKWEYLVDRILGHIHNDKVRKVAVPGMLLRTVTPNVIKVVLTDPTGLIYLDNEEAEKIFKELKREVSLISKSFDSNTISFRQDLRMVCESTIWEKYPEKSRQVRDNAITYYKKYKGQKSQKEQRLFQAEYFFHMLKDEKIPEELDSETYQKLHSYLEQSIIELPPSSKRYIRSLNRQQIDQTIIKQSTNEEWELNYTQLIKSALHGELSSLKKIHSYLKKRRPRLNDGFTEFGKWEALLLQRLNRLKESTSLINKALEYGRNLSTNNELAFDLILIKIQNLEYQKQYDKALNSAIGVENMVNEVSDLARRKLDYIKFRIRSRQIPYFETPFFLENNLKSNLALQSNFIETPWAFIFNRLNEENVSIMKDEEFIRKIRKIRKGYSDLRKLEKLSFNTLNKFLKDITYPGEHAIIVHDFIYAVESIGGYIKI